MSSWLSDRFRGALLGAAVGDALGASFEGRPTVGPEEFRSVADHAHPLVYTDDTDMMIGLARSVSQRGSVEADDLIEVFTRRYRQGSWRGYGPGPPRIFAAYERGEDWRALAGSLFEGEGSFGNGGAMRVAPVALAAFPVVTEAARLGRQSAQVTHTHPQATDGAALQAAGVCLALSSDRLALSPDAVLGRLRREVVTSEMRGRLDELAALRPGSPPALVVRCLGNGVTALDSVPTALYLFLSYATDYEQAIAAAVALGGDTDTIACMTGALVGAYLGVDAIPSTWLDRLEDAEVIAELADSLLTASSAGS